MALKRPVEMSQARGLDGKPCEGQRADAAMNASPSASSARSKSPSSLTREAKTWRDSARKTDSSASGVKGRAFTVSQALAGGGEALDGANLDGAVARHGYVAGDAQSLVQVAGLDIDKAA